MDTAEINKSKHVSLTQEAGNSWDDELHQLVRTLPREEAPWVRGTSLYLYQSCWFTAVPAGGLKPVISFQSHFQALDSDVIVAIFPKCGITWLKSLTFSTLYRHRFAKDEQHPLLSSNPHPLVPTLEGTVYLNNPCPNLENVCVYKPRAFATHLPYASLPTSVTVKGSRCKIVYMCRKPMDMFIALRFLMDKIRDESKELLPLDEAFDKFCRGIISYGPLFDHVLRYWKASRENPDKILFLRYEDLKVDMVSQVKQLAVFLGVPFSEEEEEGVVEEVAKICSFDHLKELQVNKKGISDATGIPYKEFFRKGEVGDWSNYLTPAMVERLEKLMQEELGNSGLTFKLSSKT